MEYIVGGLIKTHIFTRKPKIKKEEEEVDEGGVAEIGVVGVGVVGVGVVGVGVERNRVVSGGV